MSGGLLFTADMQADYENLDLCRQVVREMRDYGREHKALGIVFLGDLKERYNPIDGRTLNFTVWMIHVFKKANMQVHILLGNHDRFGLHSDEDSWLKALGKAGANVYSKEAVVRVGNYDLCLLPFRRESSELQKLANSLANGCGSVHRLHDGARCRILCFHAQLSECDIPVKGSGTISVDDLHPKAYDYVLGGHIHKYGRVKYDHVRYVGSPFASTWGEANQRKGFVYVE